LQIPGSYRQEAETLYVSEYTTEEVLADPSQSQTPSAEVQRIKRLVLVKADQTVHEFRLSKSEGGAVKSQCQFFFCVPCRRRYTAANSFLDHTASAHQITPSSTSSSDALVLMADSSLAEGELSPKPDETTSLFDRLFGGENVASTFMQSPFGMNIEAFAANPRIPNDLFMFSSHVINGGNQTLAQRNSSKTLKCPRCNWHYKYQETLEIHMKEKHSESEVNCLYCLQNQPHPKLARGET
jgi:hypothetical protein